MIHPVTNTKQNQNFFTQKKLSINDMKQLPFLYDLQYHNTNGYWFYELCAPAKQKTLTPIRTAHPTEVLKILN